MLLCAVRREQLPVVVFCFSKRRCDSLVDSLASLDMTSADDKSDIQVHFMQRKKACEAEQGPHVLPSLGAQQLLQLVESASLHTLYPWSLVWSTGLMVSVRACSSMWRCTSASAAAHIALEYRVRPQC
jgi:hypothetical protein